MTIALDQSSHSETFQTPRPVLAEPGIPGLSAEIVSHDAWDREAAAFDGICQEQLAAYARGRWPGVVLEPTIFRREGQAVGGALVMLQALPLRSGTIALIKWGPILAKADAADADDLMRSMIGHIKTEYGEGRGMMVSIMPMVEPTAENSGFARLLDMGFTPGEALRSPNRYVVDITPDDEHRLAGFAQKWRYHLRKSLKAGLLFERAEAAELPRFMVLYNAMTDRKRFADHSAIGTVSDLFSLPEGKGRPELFFVTHQDKTVAGAIIFATGHTATYLYGATNDDALELRAGYFLHWHIIRWLRDHTRARWYDLGGTDGSQGLHQFKSGMVGDGGYIHPLPPLANYSANLRARVTGEAAYLLRGSINRARDALDGARRSALRRIGQRFGR